MTVRIDHIAIAVRNHGDALNFFCDIFGALPGEVQEVKDKKFFWQTLALGDLTRLEMISPSGEGSFLDGFLKNRIGGFHHITIQVPNLEAMIQKLEDHSIPYFGKNEYPGGVWKEIFIHPKDAFGILIQIAEFDAEFWMVPQARMPKGKQFQIEWDGEHFVLSFAHPGGGKVQLEVSREFLQALEKELRMLLGE